MSVQAMIRSAQHTIDLERPSYAFGEAGGRVATWTAVHTQIQAWVQPARAAVVALYAQQGIRVDHRVYVYENLGAQVGDRVKYGARYLKIEGVRDTCGLSRFWVLDCAEVR
jgi:hypothetical protein